MNTYTKKRVMKKVIGIILIVVALVLGYLGINGLNESSTSVEFLGLELSAQDNQAKERSYIELGLGVIALVAGVYLVGQRRKNPA